jgi:hypothetical protein
MPQRVYVEASQLEQSIVAANTSLQVEIKFFKKHLNMLKKELDGI